MPATTCAHWFDHDLEDNQRFRPFAEPDIPPGQERWQSSSARNAVQPLRALEVRTPIIEREEPSRDWRNDGHRSERNTRFADGAVTRHFG